MNALQKFSLVNKIVLHEQETEDPKESIFKKITSTFKNRKAIPTRNFLHTITMALGRYLYKFLGYGFMVAMIDSFLGNPLLQSNWDLRKKIIYSIVVFLVGSSELNRVKKFEVLYEICNKMPPEKRIKEYRPSFIIASLAAAANRELRIQGKGLDEKGRVALIIKILH